jgi:superfamily II DNA or RNA helicase
MVEFDYIAGKRQGKVITDEDTLTFLRNHFSVKNDAAAHAKRRGQRFVKDRKYAITPTGLFDFGLYNEIRKYLIQSQITDIKFTENFKNHLKVGFGDMEVWDGLKYEQRYYQKDTVKECLKYGRGTCILATSAGKSLVQAVLVENFKKCIGRDFKCLIIVPGLSLVTQLNNDFNDYGVTFTHSGWTGDMALQDTQVVICNSENLSAQFGKNPWIVDVDLVIQDECHKITASGNLHKIISKIKTPNKFGFTGTLSEKKEDQWKTIGIFGPIIYEKKSKELRDEKYVTDVEVDFIKLNHSVTDVSESNYYQKLSDFFAKSFEKKKNINIPYNKELQFLYGSNERNKLILNIAKKLSNNTLIMVNHLIHGEILFDYFKDCGKNVYFISGEMPITEREIIKQKMETDNDIITIAMSSIFSTGINIKNIHNIMFVAGGKSFIRTVQSIGRGLRLHISKNKLRIIDIYDNMKYSERHADERKRIYEKEEILWRERVIEL